MNDVPLSVLFSILGLLIICSGFFSSSETGMMSLNRYRLRHLVKSKHRGAERAAALLEKPDRLIGTILTGNNLVNFAAAALATIISQRLWPDNPDLAVFVNTILFTLVVLIFAELTPKTLAAIAPEKIAFPAAPVLAGLQWMLYPFVWLVNTIANALLRLIRVDVNNPTPDNLSTEELRTVVREAGAMIPSRHKHMLLSILDLEKMTVNDIMVPRSDVVGIDLDDDESSILEQLRSTQHTRMPVYRGELNQAVGVLHTRNVSRFLTTGESLREGIIEACRDPYFIPESTPLHTQLFHFQKNQRRIGLVVDEYGDIQGICTLEDILEEIVGEFTTDVAAASSPDIHPQADGSYLIEGTGFVRDINRALGWELPTDGPKTFSGLIVETLEFIPDCPVCLQLMNYRIEIVEIADNTVRSARVTIAR
ncbi:HlyC/CorC family transporter [Bacterioplanes sanyensis]|uniref:HlyC/CorC family transporter n=1 Tax=Bacterioplanes sanyensis TaxID=1249553 RepID=UPI00167478AF|nr:HlyC/CorC family transporter [Bacterioplanes sanyensis]